MNERHPEALPWIFARSDSSEMLTVWERSGFDACQRAPRAFFEENGVREDNPRLVVNPCLELSKAKEIALKLETMPRCVWTSEPGEHNKEALQLESAQEEEHLEGRIADLNDGDAKRLELAMMEASTKMAQRVSIDMATAMGLLERISQLEQYRDERIEDCLRLSAEVEAARKLISELRIGWLDGIDQNGERHPPSSVEHRLRACFEREPDRSNVESKREARPEWRLQARPGQLAPSGDWTVWLIAKDRGWGKTRAASEWIRERVNAGARNIALVGPTPEFVEMMVEQLLDCCPQTEASYSPGKRRVTFANGAIATTYSAEEPDQLRGPQHDTAWCDEPAKWRYPEAWDQLMFGLRLGFPLKNGGESSERPRCVVTKKLELIDLIHRDWEYVVT
jgi:hypothetical protein